MTQTKQPDLPSPSPAAEQLARAILDVENDLAPALAELAGLARGLLDTPPVDELPLLALWRWRWAGYVQNGPYQGEPHVKAEVGPLTMVIQRIPPRHCPMFFWQVRPRDAPVHRTYHEAFGYTHTFAQAEGEVRAMVQRRLGFEGDEVLVEQLRTLVEGDPADADLAQRTRELVDKWRRMGQPQVYFHYEQGQGWKGREEWWWKDELCEEAMGPFASEAQAWEDYRKCRPKEASDE